MFWFTVLLFSLLTSILFGIGGFLLSHWLFKPKNNPSQARIYVEGIDRPFLARREIVSEKGSMFIYNKRKKSVFVPASYQVRYHYYKRLLWLDRDDRLIALPVGEDKLITSNAKNELIEELVQSHIGAEAISAIKSRSRINMTLIIIAIVIAI